MFPNEYSFLFISTIGKITFHLNVKLLTSSFFFVNYLLIILDDVRPEDDIIKSVLFYNYKITIPGFKDRFVFIPDRKRDEYLLYPFSYDIFNKIVGNFITYMFYSKRFFSYLIHVVRYRGLCVQMFVTTCAIIFINVNIFGTNQQIGIKFGICALITMIYDRKCFYSVWTPRNDY